MSDEQPNIVFFFWDNLAWGEVGCYGGGILRGAPTPRIDGLAGEGLQLLNFNVEAQCTPSRSALLTGRHPLRSGTQTVPITGGPDGLTRWEVTIAQSLSDAGYATGMWGKWHLGSDPESRSPVDFGFDEAVWSPRTADEVLWTMQSYFPDGPVTATPYAGPTEIPLGPQTIYSRKKGEKPEPVGTVRRRVPRRVRPQDHRVGVRLHDPLEAGGQAVLRLPALHAGAHPADPRPRIPGQDQARQLRRPAHADGRVHRPDPRQARRARRGRGHDRGLGLRQRRRPHLPLPRDRPRPRGRPVERVLRTVARRLLHLARGLQPRAVHRPLAGQGPGRQGQQRAGAPGRHVHDARARRERRRAHRPADRRDGHARLPARRRRGVGPQHRAVHPGQPAAGGQVAPMEDAPDRAGRHVLALDGAKHAAPLQPRVGPTRGAPGRLPPRLGRAPDGRRRRRVHEDAREGAADQARHPRPVHPAQAR